MARRRRAPRTTATATIDTVAVARLRFRWLRRCLLATDGPLDLHHALDEHAAALELTIDDPIERTAALQHWMAEREVLGVGERLIAHLNGGTPSDAAGGWRSAELDQEFPTMGWRVAFWMERMCVVPDRHIAGAPWVLAGWQLHHLLHQFRLHEDATVDLEAPSAPFRYVGDILVKPQKSGKGPFSAARICAHAVGPVLFAGWDDAGWPTGMPWATPHIQVTAVSQAQTRNIWRALMPMIQLGPLGSAIADVGFSRINLPDETGIIEPVTASAKSALGARVSHVEFDEPQSYTAANGGHDLAYNQRRNLDGTGGRWSATGNAIDPSEDSTMQRDIENPVPDVFVNYRDPLDGNWDDLEDRRRIIEHAYEDSPWVNTKRILAACARLEAQGESNQAQRYFGNRTVAGSARAWDINRVKLLRDREHDCIEPGRLVTGGFDGALTKDATGYAIVDVELGRIQIVNYWERTPDIKDSDQWEVPIGELNDTVSLVHDRWNVWRGHYDPPHYREDLNRWAGEYGEDKVVAWETSRKKAMGHALRSFTRDLEASARAVEAGRPPIMTYVGEHADALERHMRNAVKRMTNIRVDDDAETDEYLWIIGKDGKNSPRKIDLAMCVVLAWEARGLAIAAGALNKPNYARAAW